MMQLNEMVNTKSTKTLLQIIAAISIVGCLGCSEERRVAARAGEGAGIAVSVEKQELTLVKAGKVIARYRCSTARAGIGSLRESFATPLGWHRLREKIGDGLPAGAVLKDRKWTGAVWTPLQGMNEDLILSRILRLEGLEEGKNRGGDVDSWDRYIYIHGTNRVDELGRPASGGCVRMDPAEVIELFDAVEEGCFVLITND